jgi:hypothetical protein
VAATPDLYHAIGDDMQLWRYTPEEPPGTAYDPTGHTVQIVITRQETGTRAAYSASVEDGGFEFAPNDAAVIAARGAYDVVWLADDGGRALTFPNFRPLLAWVTDSEVE